MRAMRMERRGMLRGFTMIELVIVILIIGILAAVALPKLSTGGESAYKATMKTDAANARTAMTAFYSEVGDYASVTVDGSLGATKVKIDPAKSNVEIAASDGNTITIQKQTCPDGTAGYTLNITSTKTSQVINFDSCVDATIQVN